MNAKSRHVCTGDFELTRGVRKFQFEGYVHGGRVIAQGTARCQEILEQVSVLMGHLLPGVGKVENNVREPIVAFPATKHPVDLGGVHPELHGSAVRLQ